MLVLSDANEENRIIDELIQNDERLRRQHDLFVAEMEFKQEHIKNTKERIHG